MSTLVFPSLPGLDIAVSREPRYFTEPFESVSGVKAYVSWRTSARITYVLRVNFARTGTNAPSPYDTMSEVAVLLKFLDDHRGRAEAFLYVDPYTGTQETVNLVEDSIRMVQIVSGVWAVEQFAMETAA